MVGLFSSNRQLGHRILARKKSVVNKLLVAERTLSRKTAMTYDGYCVSPPTGGYQKTCAHEGYVSAETCIAILFPGERYLNKHPSLPKAPVPRIHSVSQAWALYAVQSVGGQSGTREALQEEGDGMSDPAFDAKAGPWLLSTSANKNRKGSPGTRRTEQRSKPCAQNSFRSAATVSVHNRILIFV